MKTKERVADIIAGLLGLFVAFWVVDSHLSWSKIVPIIAVTALVYLLVRLLLMLPRIICHVKRENSDD